MTGGATVPDEIRVFISSPDDIKPVRKAALRVIRELAQGKASSHGLNLIGYDQDSIPPTTVNLNRGEVAEDGIVENEIFKSCDLLIVLFWRRLGTPTGKAISGTAQEFDEAYRRFVQDFLHYDNFQ